MVNKIKVGDIIHYKMMDLNWIEHVDRIDANQYKYDFTIIKMFFTDEHIKVGHKSKGASTFLTKEYGKILSNPKVGKILFGL